MKKKLIATLVAGVVLSVSLVSLTACGGGLGVNKGEEVSNEDWAAAIEASATAKNFTVYSYVEMEIKAKGSYEGMKDELGVDSLDMNVKSTADGKIYFDLENGSYYSKATSKAKATGVPESLQGESNYQNKDYAVEIYSVKDGDTYYNAYYSNLTEGAEWKVSSSSSVESGAVDVRDVLTQSFATEEGGATATLSALYDSFTYSGGVYTATLWQHSAEVKVSVSVKGGYVVGYSMEVTNAEEEEDFSVSEVMKTVYNFSGYGSTVVKVSDAAKKAVEDYKNED